MRLCAPGLNKNLLRPIRCTRRGRGPNVGSELLQGVISAEAHAPEDPGSVHRLGAASEHLRGGIHGVVVGRRGAEVHGDVLGLARRGVHALSIARVRRRSYAGPDVSLPEVALESRVRQVVIRRRVA